jgi:hypothetical protein
MSPACPDPPNLSESIWRRRIENAFQRLASTRSQFVELLPPAGSCAGSSPKVIIAGSFNPLHAGHGRMAAVAGEITGMPVHFELSIDNADKPAIECAEAVKRLLPGLSPLKSTTPENADSPSFAPHGLLLSNHATFVRKAAEFGSVIFGLGIDTWIRLADPSFYPPRQMKPALELIAGTGGRFLVFGRTIGGEFQTVSSVANRRSFPAILLEISDAVPESAFRMEISSTTLRQNGAIRSSQRADHDC